MSLLRIAVSRHQVSGFVAFSTSNRRRERMVMINKTNDAGRHLKLTVVLLQRHVAALDRLAVTIRLRTGIALSRTSIIDALIAASIKKPDAIMEHILR